MTGPKRSRYLGCQLFVGFAHYHAATGISTFGPGTTLFQPAGALNDLGRSLPTLPDFISQPLAGSFATAQRGSG